MKIATELTKESQDSHSDSVVGAPTTTEETRLPIPDGAKPIVAETQSAERRGEENSIPENHGSGAGQADGRLKKRRKRSRVIPILLLLTLAWVGYTQRDRLMKLFSAQDTAASPSSNPGRKVLYWQDPMHPAYTSDKPGKAPDCGMDLVPVYEGGLAEAGLPEGAFRISPEKQQLIGVTYGEVVYKQISRTLKATGKLGYDETKIVRVHPKVEGWVEDVYVDFVGKEVRQGQPLVSLYSPELVATQQEYLIAIKGRNELGESPFKEAVAGADSLYEATRRRLQLWDITDEQIREIEKRGAPTKALTLYAPANGVVLARNAYPKQRVTPEVELVSIVDLSTIWLIAEIYQNEASEIRIGQTATFTLSYFPDQTFRGKVAYVYPQMDNETRTLKVRIDVANPRMLLKPEMYANVDIQVDYGRRLVVPQEAVMDSGAEQLVFVGHDGGYLEPRKVQVGENVDGKFIVLSGLRAGERIVTSGNFLVDSESKLKSAAAGMGMPGLNHGGGGAAADSKKPQPEDHSRHQPGDKPLQTKPQDHSQHQPTPVPKPPQAPKDDHSQHQSQPERKILYWYSVMHPEVRSDKPGKCPKCGMDLVPKYADEEKSN